MTFYKGRCLILRELKATKMLHLQTTKTFAKNAKLGTKNVKETWPLHVFRPTPNSNIEYTFNDVSIF